VTRSRIFSRDRGAVEGTQATPPEQKEVNMRLFKDSFWIAASVLLLATTPCLSPAASDPADKKGVIGILTKSEENKGTTPAKVEAQGDNKREKPEKKEIPRARKVVRQRLDNASREATQPPDEKLTIRRVMEILKTTRDFSGKNLSGLYLVGVDLSRCNLRGANLSRTNLERADLDEAVLERADLSGANMRMTDLRITGLKGARLNGARLDGAIWQDGTICAEGSTGVCRQNH